MHFSTTQSKIAAASAALVITGAGVAGANAVRSDSDAPGRDTQPPAMRAPAYEGDPWEKKARDDFAAAQQELRSECYADKGQRALLQKLGGC